MPTIRRRRRKDGTVTYQAIVRLKRAGKIIYQDSQVFAKQSQAGHWAEELERKLSCPNGLRAVQSSGETVGALCRRYIEFVDPVQPLGRTKRAVLEMLAVCDPLCSKRADQLSSEDMLAHARLRQADGAGPATVMQDFIYLRLVLALAKPAWGMDLITAAPVEEAMPFLKQLGLVGRPNIRERRPTPDELKRLYALFRRQEETIKHCVIPMVDLCEYAIGAIKRESEICRVLWVDYNEAKRTQVLRDMKHPRKKKGNDFEYPLMNEPSIANVPAIVARQPRVDERIFPYKAESVSARFTNACQMLEIEDLHFHDLRREGISRYFEAGYDIHEVAQISGHQDLNTLWRIYTKLQAENLHKRGRKPRLRVVQIRGR